MDANVTLYLMDNKKQTNAKKILATNIILADKYLHDPGT
jgi:predicted nucleic acid-binding protein